MGGRRRFEENCGCKTLSIYLLLFFSCYLNHVQLDLGLILFCYDGLKSFQVDFWNVLSMWRFQIFWASPFCKTFVVTAGLRGAFPQKEKGEP